MTLKNRLQKLEKQQGKNTPLVVRVYYYDRGEGYSAHGHEPYFETFEALAEAQGWANRESDVNVEVVRASDAIYIPDNGRDDEQN